MSERKTVARAIFFDQHNIMHDHDKHWREANQGIWLSAADAALAAMNKREPITDSGWRPIAEAPKDGTAFLAYGVHDHSPDDVQLGVVAGDHWWAIILWDVWREPQWVFSKDGKPTWSTPTHFRLLPPPPDGGSGK